MLPEGLLAPRLPGAAQGASITVRQSCLSDDGGTINAASLSAAAQVILSQFGSDGPGAMDFLKRDTYYV